MQIGLDGAHVLVVEDDLLVSTMLEEMLADLGCRVTVAPTVEDGFREAEQPAIDVAFVDFNVDEHSALPVAGALRERGVPFIFCSGARIGGERGLFADVAIL